MLLRKTGMELETIKSLIAKQINAKEIKVSGEGSMFDVTVVSDEFEGKTPVKKQQMVYATVNEQIKSGDIHALSIKAYTEKQWQTASKLQIG